VGSVAGDRSAAETNINRLVTEIDRHRNSSSLTAAIRVYIVDFYRSAAAAQGDRAADMRVRLTS
jgi:predicted DNA-binding ribbon-helix-helix protein